MLSGRARIYVRLWGHLCVCVFLRLKKIAIEKKNYGGGDGNNFRFSFYPPSPFVHYVMLMPSF